MVIEVGGFFEAGTLVKYNFPSEAAVVAAANRDARIMAHPLSPQEVTLEQEKVAFSFSTSSAPAVLLYVSSKTQDYLAVRYHLGGLREPFSIDVDQRNLANGQPHTFNMSRIDRSITIQLDHYPPVAYTLPDASDTQLNQAKSLFLGRVSESSHVDPPLLERYNSPGFVGCLSRVQFNGIAPLKYALRTPASSLAPPPGGTADLRQPIRGPRARHTASRPSYQGKLVESNCRRLAPHHPTHVGRHGPLAP
ncbi:hypothetical protein CRUP_032286 [Coryphaenoides rupestris]|nr:hypothetical protein CRUP_032286 [Coryphaenoides rupestris]